MIAIADLPTPCLLLDRARMHANCARMQRRLAEHGVALRPHFKTAKSTDVARAMTAGGAAIGTVSTLEEAELLAPEIRDLAYAVGIAPAKLDRAAALGVSVITDDVETAHAIAARGTAVAVWIEVDCGQGRGGRRPDDPALIAIAAALARAPHVHLRGVLTHAGHSYGAPSAGAIEAIAEDERAAAVEAAQRIRAHGIPCPEVSVGSTPTARFGRRFDGVTEVRAGVYVFFDLFQHALGVCDRDDLALSVLATVIGRREGAAWIDAGSLALSADRSMDRFGGGFGELIDRPLRVDAINQVHGRVPGLDLPVGARVRVLPNHACITAAMFDRYYVVDGGEVVGEWPRLRG